MSQETGTARVKRGMAEMLKGGVIMDVVNAEQAKIAEDAGAVAVMALERVPADIRAQGGVARMSDPDMIEKIQATVSIPVMAKVRIGHFVEAQILESLGVDYIDESEVLTPVDYENHVDKWKFKVPFVCGATNLGEALRRINEVRSSKGSSRDWQASSCSLYRRWNRNSGRCCAHDADGCRWSIYRLRNFQIWRSCSSCCSLRQGNNFLPGCKGFGRCISWTW